MKSWRTLNLGFLSGSLLFLACGAQARLIHLYDFNEPAGSVTLHDRVGNADGEVIGGADFTPDGKLVVDGASGYVNLPNGIVSKLTNATFEVWTTRSKTADWQRVFDFGSTLEGEDKVGTGTSYLVLAHVGVTRFTIAATSQGNNPNLDIPMVPLGEEAHIVVSYDWDNHSCRIYYNGRLMASGTPTYPLSSISDVNNYLGKSNFPDPFFQGSFNEFRIYDHALSDAEVFDSYRAGPTAVANDPGTLLKLFLETQSPIYSGSAEKFLLTGNFERQAGVEIGNTFLPQLSVSDPAILKVSRGRVVGLKPGKATLTAQLAGKQASSEIEVRPLPASHAYDFTGSAGDPTVFDRMANADGTLRGQGSFTADGQLDLPGIDGYVDLPNGLLSAHPSATLEFWVTWNGVGTSLGTTWQRIFDIGSSGQGEDQVGNGVTYILLSPDGADAAGRFIMCAGTPRTGDFRAGAAAPLVPTLQSHIVLTYDYEANTATLYRDGAFVVSMQAKFPLTELDDFNVWLGRSNWPDALFYGKFNEFRLYPGAIQPAQILESYQAGPDALGPVLEIGVKGGLRLAPGSTSQLTVRSIRRTRSEDSTAAVAYTSSDTSVATISAGGILEALKPGKTTLRIADGATATQVSAYVLVPAEKTLRHAYSFSDFPGDPAASDRVGGAPAQRVGAVDFSGDGSVSMQGGHLNLPNGIVSSLTNATFECWLNAASDGVAPETLFEFGSSLGAEDEDAPPKQYLAIRLDPAERTLQWAASDGGRLNETILKTDAPMGQPFHLVVTYDFLNDQSIVYIDGVERARGRAPLALFEISDINNWIGRSSLPGHSFKGSMDEFRIYEGVMTPEEVLASHDAGPGSEGNLVQVQIMNFNRSGAGRYQVRFRTVFPFREHLIEASNDLKQWAPVSEYIVVDDSQNLKTYEFPDSGARRFYRVVATGE